MTKKKSQWVVFALPSVLRLVQTTVLARLVGPHVLGVMFAALVLVNTLPRFLDLGLPHATGYFLRRNAAVRPLILLLSLGVSVVGGILSVVVLLVASRFPFADADTNELLHSLLPLFGVYVGAQLARDVSLAALVALERVRMYFAATVLPVVTGPLGLLAVGMTSPNAGPAVYLFALVGAELLGSACAIAGVVTRAPFRPPVSWELAPKILRFGVRAFPAGVSKTIAVRGDRIILSALLPPSAYALYALSLSFRDATLLPGNAYGLVLLNTLTRRILAAQPVARVVRQALLLNAAAVCIPLITFSAVGPTAVPALLGPGFAGAVPVMSTIMWSALFIGLSGVFWTWLMAAGRPGRVSAVTFVSSGLTIALVIPFAAYKGLVGAAAAVGLAAAGGLVLAVLAVRSIARGAAPST
jgi:O-antigen/teichoic acid export membrane protein